MMVAGCYGLAGTKRDRYSECVILPAGGPGSVPETYTIASAPTLEMDPKPSPSEESGESGAYQQPTIQTGPFPPDYCCPTFGVHRSKGGGGGRMQANGREATSDTSPPSAAAAAL